MDQQTVAQPGTVNLSTTLDPNTVNLELGGGAPALTEQADTQAEAAEPDSIEDVLTAESKRLREADAKADAEKEPKDKAVKADADKAEKETEKPEKVRAQDGKFAKAEKPEGEEPKVDAKAEKGAPDKAAGQEAQDRGRPSEGRQHQEPPARFLPEAREKWANVPREVKAEIHRISQEFEQDSAKFRASHERYETLKPFDDLARSNGRDLRESLTKVNEIENALSRNPIAGLDAVLREAGPRKADGSPLTIMDVAQYLSQNPQAYQPAAHSPAPQAQQQQANPEFEALKAEVLSMRAEQTVVPVIQRFADAHPDFEALSPKVTQIIDSGVIEQIYGPGLSLEQRLSEAYRMAGGSPSSHSVGEPERALAEPDTARPVNPDAGKKSVRGAPSDGADTTVDEPETDIRDMLRKEMRKLSA